MFKVTCVFLVLAVHVNNMFSPISNFGISNQLKIDDGMDQLEFFRNRVKSITKNFRFDKDKQSRSKDSMGEEIKRKADSLQSGLLQSLSKLTARYKKLKADLKRE